MNMAIKKQTLYEILEVLPNASFAEIKAAHKFLSRKFIIETGGLSREDINYKLSILDVALQTLSTPMLRDAYDAGLASPSNTTNIPLIPNPSNSPLNSKTTALELVAVIEDNNKIATAIMANQASPLTIISNAVDGSVNSLKRILKVIVTVIVLIVVIKAGGAMLTYAYIDRGQGVISKAEEKAVLQEYYQEHGVRPGSLIEADLLEVERLREENEQRAEALDTNRRESEYKNFVEESRRIGNQVSNDLLEAERNARYEAQQEQEKIAREERERKEAEIREIANRRAKWGLETHDNQLGEE